MKREFTTNIDYKLSRVSDKLSFAQNISPVFYLFILLGAFLFTGCVKENTTGKNTETSAQKADKEPLTYYEGLDFQTLQELQQARAASSKYQNIANALADGYEDIHVVMPNMGYHFMKTANVDGTFDIRNPEILVYNKNEQGQFELGAVEYAIPLALSATPPAGFTGSTDVWDPNSDFGLWLLHAWVWKNNPEGVFNPTNSRVQVR